MRASLNRKFRAVKWGEYKLEDLFEIKNTLSFNADKLTSGQTYDYVTRTSLNQGVLKTTGFVNSENINGAGTWSLGLLQMDFFYRNKPWYAGQFVKKIIPKIAIPQDSIPFFTTILNKQKPILLSVLVRDVDTIFKNIIVELPITDDNKLDFEVMKEIVGMMEETRIRKLYMYLKTQDLIECKLSDEEMIALRNFKNIKWRKYRMGDLFEELHTNKLPYKARELPGEATGKYVLPCLTSSFKNQGLNYYAPRAEATILKNVITIPKNSDVYRAYYQSRDFTVLSDAYAIKWKDAKKEISSNQYLFMVMCINKVTNLPIYSYKNKLGGWNIVKNKYIMLPEVNGKIDFKYMDNFVSAMKKLMIRDVVQYTNRKIKNLNI